MQSGVQGNTQEKKLANVSQEKSIEKQRADASRRIDFEILESRIYKEINAGIYPSSDYILKLSTRKQNEEYLKKVLQEFKAHEASFAILLRYNALNEIQYLHCISMMTAIRGVRYLMLLVNYQTNAGAINEETLVSAIKMAIDRRIITPTDIALLSDEKKETQTLNSFLTSASSDDLKDKNKLLKKMNEENNYEDIHAFISRYTENVGILPAKYLLKLKEIYEKALEEYNAHGLSPIEQINIKLLEEKFAHPTRNKLASKLNDFQLKAIRENHTIVSVSEPKSESEPEPKPTTLICVFEDIEKSAWLNSDMALIKFRSLLKHKLPGLIKELADKSFDFVQLIIAKMESPSPDGQQSWKDSWKKLIENHVDYTPLQIKIMLFSLDSPKPWQEASAFFNEIIKSVGKLEVDLKSPRIDIIKHLLAKLTIPIDFVKSSPIDLENVHDQNNLKRIITFIMEHPFFATVPSSDLFFLSLKEYLVKNSSSNSNTTAINHMITFESALHEMIRYKSFDYFESTLPPEVVNELTETQITIFNKNYRTLLPSLAASTKFLSPTTDGKFSEKDIKIIEFWKIPLKSLIEEEKNSTLLGDLFRANAKEEEEKKLLRDIADLFKEINPLLGEVNDLKNTSEIGISFVNTKIQTIIKKVNLNWEELLNNLKEKSMKLNITITNDSILQGALKIIQEVRVIFVKLEKLFRVKDITYVSSDSELAVAHNLLLIESRYSSKFNNKLTIDEALKEAKELLPWQKNMLINPSIDYAFPIAFIKHFNDVDQFNFFSKVLDQVLNYLDPLIKERLPYTLLYVLLRLANKISVDEIDALDIMFSQDFFANIDEKTLSILWNFAGEKLDGEKYPLPTEGNQIDPSLPNEKKLKESFSTWVTKYQPQNTTTGVKKEFQHSKEKTFFSIEEEIQTQIEKINISKEAEKAKAEKMQEQKRRKVEETHPKSMVYDFIGEIPEGDLGSSTEPEIEIDQETLENDNPFFKGYYQQTLSDPKGLEDLFNPNPKSSMKMMEVEDSVPYKNPSETSPAPQLKQGLYKNPELVMNPFLFQMPPTVQPTTTPVNYHNPSGTKPGTGTGK